MAFAIHLHNRGLVNNIADDGFGVKDKIRNDYSDGSRVGDCDSSRRL